VQARDISLSGENNAGRIKGAHIDELKDLYNAENQLVKALPKMAKAASFGRTAPRL
jgi:ferritin-like metal-binding protein YciE